MVVSAVGWVVVVANVGTRLSVSGSTTVSKSEGNDLAGALFLREGSWDGFPSCAAPEEASWCSLLPLPHLQKEWMKWSNVTVGGPALLLLPQSNPNGGRGSFLVSASCDFLHHPSVRCQGGEQSQSARRANSLSYFCHIRMMLGEADGNCAALSITHCDVLVSCVGSKKGRSSVEFSHCRL